MSRKEWANIVLCLIVFSIAGYGIHRIAGASDIADLFNPAVGISTLAAELADEVTLDSFTFEINGVTKEVKAGFALTNSSHSPVSDIVISCDFIDKEKELRGRGRWVIYERVEPSKSAHFVVEDRRYISYLVVPENVLCRIVDLKAQGISVASHGSAAH